MHTKTRSIKFKSVQRCYSYGKKEITRGVLKVIDVYKARGLSISAIFGDNEFEKIREAVEPICLNIVEQGRNMYPTSNVSLEQLRSAIDVFVVAHILNLLLA